MKTFANANPRDLPQAFTMIKQAQAGGKSIAIAGGGSDLLGMVKERIVTPDVLVNLKAIKGLDQVAQVNFGLNIGGLITLDVLARHPIVRSKYAVLAEAADSVATPQIRNVGTLAGDVCHRPWCWDYRNGVKCHKATGNTSYTLKRAKPCH